MNMKHIAVATLALSTAVIAANSHAAEATATSTATVIAPIAITAPVNLVFGSFAPGAGGSVTVSTSGARTATGAILSTVGNAPSAAKFDVTGDGSSTYSIAIAPSANLSDGSTTPNTMALATFSDLTGGGATSGNVTSGTLASGAQSIYVGGTLTVSSTQAASTAYAGTVAVTVEYN
ncbi:MAG: DUF4402 domain-containing protein [Pseudomonadota bacterium]|nr:DUF4402 domain-containing protein [Pseudomonadota bacterium]